MKKIYSIIIAFLVVLNTFGIVSNQVFAEEQYTLIEPGFNKDEAAAIELNTMYAAPLTGNDTIFLKFTTPDQKGYFDFYSMNINIPTHNWSADSALRFELINDIDQIIATNYLFMGAESSTNTSLLPATTYYIRIQNYCVDDKTVTGNLKVKITYTEDTVSNTMEDAKEISLCEMVTGTIDGHGDVDYYQFKTGPEGFYEVSVKNIDVNTHTWSLDHTFSVQIRNSINEILLDQRAFYGKQAEEAVNLQADEVYYIYITNPFDGSDDSTGTYWFSIEPPDGFTKTSVDAILW